MSGGGKVYLVGGGPGDPDLITVKGHAILELAEVIVYDNLISRELLGLAPKALHIYAGKKKSDHAMPQEEICALLVQHAREGKRVVRLKGGDPFIFGRGGEEMEALTEAGIPYEVVPGVTAALGIAAYNGVPLTHRDHTSVVSFVTGHNPDQIDWNKVGHAETLVLYMGLSNLTEIARRLIEAGRNPATPAMAVRWATRATQSTIVGTLATLPALVEQARMKPPATIVIGEVVGLREKLNWYERLPLFGKKIVITRAAAQSATLGHRLHELGADVVELPVIAFAPPLDPGPLDQALANLQTYDWLIFTSANGVRYFLERLDQSPFDLRSLRAKLCAIGPATARELEALHLKVDVIPEEYVAESLVAAMRTFELEVKRVLIPRAAVARDVVPDALRAMGAAVDVVETYRTVVPAASEAKAKELFESARKPDWITFTSSSTVKNFLSLAGTGSLTGVHVASIGPVTSDTARMHGLTVDAEAQPHTIDGLIQAILLGPAALH